MNNFDIIIGTIKTYRRVGITVDCTGLTKRYTIERTDIGSTAGIRRCTPTGLAKTPVTERVV